MNGDRDAAITAVRARLTLLDMTQGQLATEAHLSLRTIETFLSGTYWPKPATRASIEAALGWRQGTLHELAYGATTGSGVVYSVNLADGWDANLNDVAKAEIHAQVIALIYRLARNLAEEDPDDEHSRARRRQLVLRAEAH